MSKHTPGPWKAISTNAEGTAALIVPVNDRSAYDLIARVDDWYQFSGLPTSMPWGNARLIASAPEMLAALETIIERFGPVQKEMIFSKRNAIDKVRAAIAKAIGSQDDASPQD